MPIVHILFIYPVHFVCFTSLCTLTFQQIVYLSCFEDDVEESFVAYTYLSHVLMMLRKVLKKLVVIVVDLASVIGITL